MNVKNKKLVKEQIDDTVFEKCWENFEKQYSREVYDKIEKYLCIVESGILINISNSIK